MKKLLFAGLVFSLALGGTAILVAQPPKDEGVKPINLDKLNTAADEDDPFAASNGLALYYSCNANKKVELLASLRRAATTPWPTGKAPDSYLKTDLDTRSVYVTPEGYYPQYLYYATQDKEVKNFDIYVMVRQGPNAAFSAPTPINSVCTADDELNPWLANGGKQLYFSRKTKEGWRVFVASRKDVVGAGGFGDPVMVKELPADYHHATISGDGKVMYLQGPLEKDRVGLFRSTWNGKEWSKPEELTDLNHAEAKTGTRSPALNRDGTMLYFSSDRPDGKGGMDLWVVPTAQLKKK